MSNSHQHIVLPKEISDWIEATWGREENYYSFPHYYKKLGDQLYEIVDFKDIPGTHLRRIVERSEPRSEEEFNNKK